MTASGHQQRGRPDGSPPSRVVVLGSANMDLVVTVDRAPYRTEIENFLEYAP